jgi:hypothetical protein
VQPYRRDDENTVTGVAIVSKNGNMDVRQLRHPRLHAGSLRTYHHLNILSA